LFTVEDKTGSIPALYLTWDAPDKMLVIENTIEFALGLLYSEHSSDVLPLNSLIVS